jgi:hypothetical protein
MREDLSLKTRMVPNMPDLHTCPHGHEDIMILALWHGGGVYPYHMVPELFCKKCFLNVSLHPFSSIDTRFEKINKIAKVLKSIGIDFTKELIQQIKLWASDAPFEKDKVFWVDDFTNDPLAISALAPNFSGDLSGLKIINKPLLDRISGK